MTRDQAEMQLYGWLAATCIFVIIVIALYGCTTKKYIPVEVATKEYVTVHDTSVVVKMRYQTDTAYIQAEADTASSYLQNRYCFSSARWDGKLLTHELTTKNTPADTITIHDVREVVREKEVPKVVQVQKHSLKNNLWHTLIGLFLGLLIYALIVKYKK